MPALNLTLGLPKIRRAGCMRHAVIFQIVGKSVADMAGSIV